MALETEGISNCDTVKKARAWLDERGSIFVGSEMDVLRAETRRPFEESGLSISLVQPGTNGYKIEFIQRA